mmetsp:Transcript_10732/g.22677  ORF Transcript_10732/g.22677 Transcript_10732/m.22677 type:complete len:241 (+) Transcript_10732:1379-2101(+)
MVHGTIQRNKLYRDTRRSPRENDLFLLGLQQITGLVGVRPNVADAADHQNPRTDHFETNGPKVTRSQRCGLADLSGVLYGTRRLLLSFLSVFLPRQVERTKMGRLPLPDYFRPLFDCPLDGLVSLCLLHPEQRRQTKQEQRRANTGRGLDHERPRLDDHIFRLHRLVQTAGAHPNRAGRHCLHHELQRVHRLRPRGGGPLSRMELRGHHGHRPAAAETERRPGGHFHPVRSERDDVRAQA